VKKNEILRLLVLGGGILVTGWVHNFLAAKGVVLVENRGLAFGWFKGGAGLAVLVWLVLWWYWWFGGWGGAKVGIWMMLIGGAVNIWDRWVGGVVRDYWRWFDGVIYNNVADWLISVGLFVFILEIWKDKSK